MRIQIDSTGEIISEMQWYERNPSVAFAQPLTNEVLLEANQFWPDRIVLAHIFFPTIEWARNVAMNRVALWEYDAVRSQTTTLVFAGSVWTANTEFQEMMVSWLMWDTSIDGPWPDWFGWQDVDWTDHYMTQAEFLEFAELMSSTVADLLAPVYLVKQQMLDWIASCDDTDALERFNGTTWVSPEQLYLQAPNDSQM